MPAKTTWTIADYLLALDEPDGPHYELSEGELVVSPSTTLRHNTIRDKLNAALRVFLESSAAGLVTSETDFQLGSATVRRPDVAVISAAHYRPEYEQQIPIPVAPDLAFEVVSTHDRPKALQLKVRQYLAAGTQAVWLLYPDSGEAHRYAGSAAEPEIRRAAGGGCLEAPALLPGWSLELKKILPLP